MHKTKARSTTKSSSSKTRKTTCVAGIGTSAGGLNALRALFGAMPRGSDIAFVVVQHLTPDHKSYLAELLGQSTSIPVLQAKQGMRVEPDHIYVIPPNTSMSIAQDILHLVPREEAHGHRLPIDHFFRTLGEDQCERAIAIVLSGAGSDGAAGLRSIEANGGMILVQDPDSAEFNSMPRSAIATGTANFVLAVEKMPAVLMGYACHPYASRQSAALDTETEATAFDAIYALIRAHVGYNFDGYKPSTLARRIYRRMGLRSLVRIDEYVVWLEQHPEEIDLLFRDLLICVTDFFRDPDAWKILERDVVAPIVAKKADNQPIRVWVTACATGEEAFSVAILFLEALRQANKHCPLQVFATDVSEAAMQYARNGVYPAGIAERLGPALLQRFFEPLVLETHSYKVGQALRDVVMFGTQNLVSDPPFSRLNLVTCRNLLIYLEPKAQQKILSVFHFALEANAYLFLGSAETVGTAEPRFKPLSKKWRIYQRLGTSNPPFFPVSSERSITHTKTTLRPEAPPLVQVSDLAQQLLLDRFVPAAVMVNSKYEILYFCGPTERFLLRPRGAPTHDLFAQARNGLRAGLRAALSAAIKSGESVVATDARIKRGDTFEPVKLTVTPVKDGAEKGKLLLVVFEDMPRVEATTGEHSVESTLMRQLEEELHATRTDLQRAIERLEISNDELRISNAEVVSVNEELQSVNEELESSKEELQSLNEELYTVNQQLESKVFELEAANDDLNNLLASSDIATLCLNTEMRIKWFTPALQKIFKLVPSDLGRPISDFSEALSGPTLVDEASSVLKTLTPTHSELPSADGHWYFRRMLPYRTDDNHVVGVVIAYTDITESKRATETALQVKQQMAEALELRVLERTAQLRTLTMALSVTEERERRTLAQDLHDDLGQVLALASIKLAVARKANRSAPVKELLEKVEALLTQANQSVRSLAFQLCPPVLYELGLVAGLEWLSEEMRNRYNLEVEFEDDGQAKQLDTAVCTILFRAVRELLINVSKHAEVQSASIAAKLCDDHIEIAVTDGGVGFDAETTRAKSPGFGILSIRERLFYIGGNSRVESAPGRGTRVLLTAPLASKLSFPERRK
jgi:two-component system CheB/CheR fusion protein